MLGFFSPGLESGEDGYILNVRFSASLQRSALMSQATDRNYINIEIRAWGDSPGLMLHDIESHVHHQTEIAADQGRLLLHVYVHMGAREAS